MKICKFQNSQYLYVLGPILTTPCQRKLNPNIEVKELNEKHIPFPRAVKVSKASPVILVLVPTSDMNSICKDNNRKSDRLFMYAQEPSFDLDIQLSTSINFLCALNGLTDDVIKLLFLIILAMFMFRHAL